MIFDFTNMAALTKSKRLCIGISKQFVSFETSFKVLFTATLSWVDFS